MRESSRGNEVWKARRRPSRRQHGTKFNAQGSKAPTKQSAVDHPRISCRGPGRVGRLPVNSGLPGTVRSAGFRVIDLVVVAAAGGCQICQAFNLRARPCHFPVLRPHSPTTPGPLARQPDCGALAWHHPSGERADTLRQSHAARHARFAGFPLPGCHPQCRTISQKPIPSLLPTDPRYAIVRRRCGRVAVQPRAGIPHVLLICTFSESALWRTGRVSLAGLPRTSAMSAGCYMLCSKGSSC